VLKYHNVFDIIMIKHFGWLMITVKQLCYDYRGLLISQYTHSGITAPPTVWHTFTKENVLFVWEQY